MSTATVSRFLLLTFCWSCRVGAQQEPQPVEPLGAQQEPEKADANRARIEYQKGNAAFRDGSYTRARHYYRRALKAEETFDILCNLGRTESKLGQDAAALEHLTRCLELYPDDPELRETRDKFAALHRKIRDGMDPAELEQVEARLEETRTDDDGASAPDATTREAAPTQAPAPESGKMESSFGAGADAPPTADRSRPSWRLPVSLGVGGLGLLGIGVGTGLFVHAGSLDAAAQERREALGPGACRDTDSEACSGLANLVAESDDAFNAGVAGVAVGGVLVSGAILTYLLWPQAKEASARRRALPYATVSGVEGGWQVGVRGRF